MSIKNQNRCNQCEHKSLCANTLKIHKENGQQCGEALAKMQPRVMAAYATLRGRPPMASWPVGVISYSKIDVTLKEPKVSHGLWLPSFFGKSPLLKV